MATLTLGTLVYMGNVGSASAAIDCKERSGGSAPAGYDGVRRIWFPLQVHRGDAYDGREHRRRFGKDMAR